MTDNIQADIRFSIVPEWLVFSGVSDRALRLYAILARYADNDSFQAFPSRGLLAKRCNCSLKSVDRAVEELIEFGAIVKKRRIKDNHYQSSLYTIKRSGPVDVANGGDMGDARAASVVTLGGVTGDATAASRVTHRTITTELEPLNENEISEHFNTFWDLYPRKLGKGEAKGAFAKAFNVFGHDVILDGVKRFASDPNLPVKQFIPRPATWLNQQRWDDEPYPETEMKPWERPASGPGIREWVRALHETGEHYECRPGEFGH
jgi:hypothetical protein